MISLSRFLFKRTTLQARSISIPAVYFQEYKGEQTSDQSSAKDNYTVDLSKLLSPSINPNTRDLFSTLKILFELHNIKQINFQDVFKNPNYPSFFENLKTKGHNGSPKDVLFALQSLYSIEGEMDTRLIESLQNDALWNLHRMPIGLLVKTFQFAVNHQESKLEKELLTHTLKTLQMRCKELSFSWEFTVLYENSHKFSLEFLDRVDDRAAEMGHILSPKEIVRILISITKSGRRPLPLIRSLYLNIMKKKEPIHPEDICNAFYAMSKFNLVELPLVTKLISDLTHHQDMKLSKFIISSLFSSLGRLQIKDITLLEMLSDYVSNKLQDYPPSVFISYLLMLAHIHYKPDDSLIKKILAIFNLKEMSNSDLINLVWSLVVLDLATEEHISILFDKFPTIEDSPKDFGLKLKLLNIDAASCTLPDYQGNRIKNLNLESFKFTFTSNSDKKDINSYVAYAVECFAGIDNVATDIFMPMGFKIPIATFYSKAGEFLNVKKHFKSLDFTKMAPDVQKIAVMPFNYKDYTICSETLTGPNNLYIKLLKANGFKVVDVPYWGLNINEPLSVSANILERKIMKVLKPISG